MAATVDILILVSTTLVVLGLAGVGMLVLPWRDHELAEVRTALHAGWHTVQHRIQRAAAPGARASTASSTQAARSA